MKSVEDRLKALESSNDRAQVVARRWKLAAVTLAVTLAAVLCGAAGQADKPAGDVPDVIRARRFEVVDVDGKVTGRFKDDVGHGVFSLYDHKGDQRIYLMGTDDPSLFVIGRDRTIALTSIRNVDDKGTVSSEATVEITKKAVTPAGAPTRETVWRAP